MKLKKIENYWKNPELYLIDDYKYKFLSQLLLCIYKIIIILQKNQHPKNSKLALELDVDEINNTSNQEHCQKEEDQDKIKSLCYSFLSENIQIIELKNSFDDDDIKK